MGREIRRVPPNWEHPREYFPKSGEDFRPLYDKTYTKALREWEVARRLYRLECIMPSVMALVKKIVSVTGPKDWWWALGKDLEFGWNDFAEWHGEAPDRDYYRRKWKRGEATWYQIYETVSEGTPVTPPFETKEELAKHLMEHGTDWDSSPWTEKQARGFLGEGWAPSGWVINGMVMSPQEGIEAIAKEE